MANASVMRSCDIVGVVRLVGECRELWADADAWPAHLLRGACRLSGTSAGVFTESRLAPDRTSTTIVQEVDLGWRDDEAQAHRRRMFDEHPDRVAFLPKCYRLAGRAMDDAAGVASVLRPEMVSDRAWYRGYVFNSYWRPACVDGFVLSFAVNRRTGNLVSLYLCQDLTDPSPAGRAKAVTSLLNELIAPLVGVELAGPADRGLRGLSPRVRQTLDALLAGDSEKEAARRLGLTRPTVHQYVGMLFRHFRVRSRSELMAYFVHRRPTARTR